MPSVVLLDFPEPDFTEGAPHPRMTAQVLGHSEAEREFLAAFNSGRSHHAWLLSGARGIGKATLAWRIARFLLTTAPGGGLLSPEPPQSLDVAPDHPVLSQIEALSEPRLYLLRRGLNDQKPPTPSAQILVKEVRELSKFFHLSAADGGRRVAIVDCMDEMNVAAANAFLKLLEEPPPNVTFLLISHQPAQLLPTIRSRCRSLRLGPLSPNDLSDALTAAGGAVDPGDRLALAELAGGSVGVAFELTNLNGLELYQSLIDLLGGLPQISRSRLQALSDAGSGKGNEAQFDLIVTLIDLFLARLARAAAIGGLPPDAARGEGDLIARLSTTPQIAPQQAALTWANLAQALGGRARAGRAVNLDAASLLLDMLLAIESEARILGVTRSGIRA